MRLADVRAVLELVGTVMFPTLLALAVLGAIRVYRWFSARRRPAAGVFARAEPIELLCANVRRLHAALEAEENQMGTPAKVMRVRARRAAYIDVLTAACERFGVNPPCAARAGGWVPLTEIYRVEVALREHGLDVRQPAPR